MHQTQSGANELSKQAGTRLAKIFPQCHMASPVQSTFNVPMVSDQLEEPSRRNPLHRKATDPIDDLITDFSRFEDLRRALEPKYLLYPFPIFAKLVVEIRAADNLEMLHPLMRFVLCFGLLPLSPVWGGVLK